MAHEVDPHAARYWDAGALDQELARVFDICHSCRRCFNLCPSFPALFDAVDAHDDEVAGLTAGEKRRVVDLCYQCKLCDPHCPYTPPHHWMVDFPRLMLRARAVRARAEGVPLQDRLLGATDAIGRVGSALPGLVNALNRNPLSRALLERTAGIHRAFPLPAYRRPTFQAWWRRRRPQAAGGASGPAPASAGDAGHRARVALFVTCTVNYSQPGVGRDAVAVLEHNGVEVVVPEQECCGMPAVDGGDAPGAMAAAARNVAALAPWVERGYVVIAPGPTCSYTLKREYPLWVQGEAARQVAGATRDLGEYLMERHREGALRTDFPGPVPGKVAYHLACHLKAQNIGFRSRDLLRLAGADVQMVERCSGVDGTWGMKREYYEAGLKVAAPLLREVDGAGGEAVATDCPLAGLRLEKAGHAPCHPVTLLRRAYGLPGEDPEP